MKKSIKFSELSEEDKNYYTERVVVGKLQHYISNFNKMRKASLTPLEILRLRGLPLNYNEVRKLLEEGKIIINSIDKNSIEIVEPKNIE